MITPPTKSIRIVRQSVAFSQRLAQMVGSREWVEQARVLKQERRTSVLAGSCDFPEDANAPATLDVVVKTMALTRPKDLLSRLFGTTRLMRQWRGAEKLQLEGFVSPQSYVLFRGKDDDGRTCDCLVIKELPGSTLLQEVASARLTFEQQRDLAREAGMLTARLLNRGLGNRDHKPSNLLVGADVRSLVLIDSVGIVAARRVSEASMLANLVVEFLGTNTLPRRALLAEALRAFVRTRVGHSRDEPGGVPLAGHSHGGFSSPAEREKFRKLWRDVAHLIEQHGDPTPKDDPLR